MREGKKNGGELDLLALCGVVLRRWPVVALAALLGGLLALGGTKLLVTPQYESSVMLYVNNSYGEGTGFTINSSELSAAQSLVDTYIVILSTPETLEAVIDRTGVGYTWQELSEMLSAEPVDSTEIFRIAVRSSDPAEAALLVNAIADVLPGQISDVVDGSSVRVVSRGREDARPVSPRCGNAAVLGAIVGLLLGCGAALAMELLDQAVRGEADLEEGWGLPVLAAIPELPAEGEGRLCGRLNLAAAEAYKLLRTNLLFTLPARGCRVLGVTSPVLGEGKTTTAINLSHTLAQTGKRVLLLDGDLRRSSVAGQLGLGGAPGLTNLLAGLCGKAEEVLRPSGQLENWTILPAGDRPPDPSGLLGSEEMEALMAGLVRTFDFIVVDLPPVNLVSDAMVAARHMDGLLVTVRRGRTDRRALARCMKLLELPETKVLGFVLTGVREANRGYSYRYSGEEM